MRQPAWNGANRNEVVGTVAAVVATLDDLMAEFPDLAHTYVKIANRGSDLEALKGGSELLRSACPS